MFEYLMPPLFMESYPSTLMDESCRVAIEQQIQYGAENSIPWGTSEASYYTFDAQQVYQYQAFGVPSLGYKRGLSNELVVAPYASILALPFLPQEVMQNLARLEKLKMWGLYGFYESVDFTPERLKTGESHAIIRSYMVHHQGMILLSLCNYLFDKRMIRRFHADPDRGGRAGACEAHARGCGSNHRNISFMKTTPKENRFEFVVIASARARQLLRGAEPREAGEKKVTIAQREVLRRKVVKIEEAVS